MYEHWKHLSIMKKIITIKKIAQQLLLKAENGLSINRVMILFLNIVLFITSIMMISFIQYIGPVILTALLITKNWPIIKNKKDGTAVIKVYIYIWLPSKRIYHSCSVMNLLFREYDNIISEEQKWR